MLTDRPESLDIGRREIQRGMRRPVVATLAVTPPRSEGQSVPKNFPLVHFLVSCGKSGTYVVADLEWRGEIPFVRVRPGGDGATPYRQDWIMLKPGLLGPLLSTDGGNPYYFYQEEIAFGQSET
jgi:hypothetical protein